MDTIHCYFWSQFLKHTSYYKKAKSVHFNKDPVLQSTWDGRWREEVSFIGVDVRVWTYVCGRTSVDVRVWIYVSVCVSCARTDNNTTDV